MSRSSLTEETPSTPGWVDRRVREIFAPFAATGAAVGDAYANCLAEVRGAVEVDAGHDGCRRAALAAIDASPKDLEELDRILQALEAEISNTT